MSTTSSRTAKLKPRQQQLGFEGLEAREVLATIVMTGFGTEPTQSDFELRTGVLTAGAPTDIYQMNLNHGDVLHVSLRDESGNRPPSHLVLRGGVNEVFMKTAGPLPDLPVNTTLPTGGDIELAYVIATGGAYHVEVGSDSGGSGSYRADFSVVRPGSEYQPPGTKQVLFLDFDGAVVDVENDICRCPGSATSGDIYLPGVRDYLDDYGLVSSFTPRSVVDDVEQQLIEHIVATVTENFDAPQGAIDIEIVDSRTTDAWGATNVSRVIVGGDNSLTSLPLTGRAESNDPGNIALAETALAQFGVSTNLLTSEVGLRINPAIRNQLSAKIKALAIHWGNIISHEAAHLFGGYHTDGHNTEYDLMDASGLLTAFLGPNGVFDGNLPGGDDRDLEFGTDVFRVVNNPATNNVTFTQGGFYSPLDWMSIGLTAGHAVPGDADLDRDVDLDDYHIWREHRFRRDTNWQMADFNGDSVTDVLDFNIWNSHNIAALADLAFAEIGDRTVDASIGIDEHSGHPVVVADINSDKQIDTLDLNALAIRWQQTVAPWNAGDLNGDGAVDQQDMLLLLYHWRGISWNTSPAYQTGSIAVSFEVP